MKKTKKMAWLVDKCGCLVMNVNGIRKEIAKVEKAIKVKRRSVSAGGIQVIASMEISACTRMSEQIPQVVKVGKMMPKIKVDKKEVSLKEAGIKETFPAETCCKGYPARKVTTVNTVTERRWNKERVVIRALKVAAKEDPAAESPAQPKKKQLRSLKDKLL